MLVCLLKLLDFCESLLGIERGSEWVGDISLKAQLAVQHSDYVSTNVWFGGKADIENLKLPPPEADDEKASSQLCFTLIGCISPRPEATIFQITFHLRAFS